MPKEKKLVETKSPIDRHFKLLKIIENTPMSLSDIAKLTGIPKSTLTSRNGMLHRLNRLHKIRKMEEGVHKGKYVAHNFNDIEFEMEQILEKAGFKYEDPAEEISWAVLEAYGYRSKNEKHTEALSHILERMKGKVSKKTSHY